MQQLDTDLWISDTPLRFAGIDVGARMTAIRLADETLLLHSPIRASTDLVNRVRTLGPVGYIVAPNLFHHLFVSEWKSAFPEAAIHVAPGLEKKRSDLEITSVLGDDPESGWTSTVDQVAVSGLPFANEVVFFHRPSATLIVSDLAFNVGPSCPRMTRVAFRLLGAYGRVTPTLLERLMVRDRDAFRASLERILRWPFERIVVAHGAVSEQGGREELIRGYSWALGRKGASSG